MALPRRNHMVCPLLRPGSASTRSGSAYPCPRRTALPRTRDQADDTPERTLRMPFSPVSTRTVCMCSGVVDDRVVLKVIVANEPCIGIAVWLESAKKPTTNRQIAHPRAHPHAANHAISSADTLAPSSHDSPTIHESRPLLASPTCRICLRTENTAFKRSVRSHSVLSGSSFPRHILCPCGIAPNGSL